MGSYKVSWATGTLYDLPINVCFFLSYCYTNKTIHVLQLRPLSSLNQKNGFWLGLKMVSYTCTTTINFKGSHVIELIVTLKMAYQWLSIHPSHIYCHWLITATRQSFGTGTRAGSVHRLFLSDTLLALYSYLTQRTPTFLLVLQRTTQ